MGQEHFVREGKFWQFQREVEARRKWEPELDGTQHVFLVDKRTFSADRNTPPPSAGLLIVQAATKIHICKTNRVL